MSFGVFHQWVGGFTLLFMVLPWWLTDRWEAFFGIDDGDMSDSSSMTSDDMTSAKGKAGDDDAKAEARSNKKVSCLKPKRPVVMPADG